MSFNAIALSGKPGSGKSTLLRKLHSRLGWEQKSVGGLLRELHKSWQEQDLGNRQSIGFTAYYSDKVLVSEELLKSLNSDLSIYLSKGNTLVDSRFATMNAKGLSNVLTVYLHAPIEVRVHRSIDSPQYKGLSSHDIFKDLNLRQRLESERGQETYGHSFECHNVLSYMLVINNNHLTIDQEADIICSILE